jgi:flavin reductase (DIM6/NTAB) family NADH-FMN oxidoreductase RutF
LKQKDVIPAGDDWIAANIREFSGSPAARIGSGWMLVSTGNVSSDKGNWNTMTASWGGLGVLWSTDVAFVFIRPTRRTFELANASSLFSLSFFGPQYRKALEICGSRSGRDTDKAETAGLSPVVFKDGAVGFKEASEIIVCNKIYAQDFDPGLFLDSSIEKNYPDKDYHRMLVGKILTMWIRK